MKIKQFKKYTFLILLFFIISLFFYLRFKTYNYTTNYVVDKYKIKETYEKENGKYTFLINIDNITYAYYFKEDYIKKEELIDNINIYKNEKEVCILPESIYIKFYPLCSSEGNVKAYNLSSIEIKEFRYKKYSSDNINNDKLKIKYLNDTKYLLYNYKGFYYLNDNTVKEIKIFDNDVYKIDLIYQMNEYLIVPNYNDNYFFNMFFIINMKNGKVKKLKINKEISFNSEFLGDFKNNVYLIDKKEEKEYKINIKKLTIEEIDFTALKDDKLINVEYKDIINNNLKFANKKEIPYKIIDDKLYQVIHDNQVLISEEKVDKIISEIDNTVYYLSKDNLYMFNNTYGEVLLINNFEWNFNNTNMIYLYK